MREHAPASLIIHLSRTGRAGASADSVKKDGAPCGTLRHSHRPRGDPGIASSDLTN
jgi:hypothetical protein